jgi:hypothetical protein
MAAASSRGVRPPMQRIEFSSSHPDAKLSDSRTESGSSSALPSRRAKPNPFPLARQHLYSRQPSPFWNQRRRALHITAVLPSEAPSVDLGVPPQGWVGKYTRTSQHRHANHQHPSSTRPHMGRESSIHSGRSRFGLGVAATSPCLRSRMGPWMPPAPSAKTMRPVLLRNGTLLFLSFLVALQARSLVKGPAEDDDEDSCWVRNLVRVPATDSNDPYLERPSKQAAHPAHARPDAA